MASTSNDIPLLAARVRDAVGQASRRGRPVFLGFLTEQERGEAEAILAREADVAFAFDGGFPQAERGMLAVFPRDFPPHAVKFPFAALGFTYREQATLCHRDFLGSLLACGIKREAVGDILCGKGLAVAFVQTDLLPFLSEQIDRIGREGVTLHPHYDGALPATGERLERRLTVASLRLDAVLAALIGVSRSTAVETIEAGLVSVQHRVCTKPACEVQSGDTLSVRGKGRFAVDEVLGLTHKGRRILRVWEYI